MDINERLKEAISALRLIYEDPEEANCTCEARGWYGDECDSACPLTIAGETLGRIDNNEEGN